MTEFNPLAGSILQSTQVQRQSEADKQRQVRRAQALAKDVAARGDHFEHEVESADAVAPVQNNGQQGQQRRHPSQPAEDRDQSAAPAEPLPRLDLTA